MKKIIVVVDMQNDFIDGSLGTAEAQEMLPRLKKKLKQVTDNPAECFRAARVNVPNEIMHDQQKTVMHLIRTGQVGGPAMRIVGPILARMGIKI